MVRIAERSQLTPDAYLAWERLQESKHAYFDAEVFAMARGTPRHNRLCSSVIVALGNALGTKCNVFTSDQRLRVPERRYVYADAVVVCGAPGVESDDVIANPTIVVEVLSQPIAALRARRPFDRSPAWRSVA